MRITILSGSPRKGGNTDLLAQAFAEGAKQRLHVEIIHVTELNIHPCLEEARLLGASIGE